MLIVVRTNDVLKSSFIAWFRYYIALLLVPFLPPSKSHICKYPPLTISSYWNTFKRRLIKGNCHFWWTTSQTDDTKRLPTVGLIWVGGWASGRNFAMRKPGHSNLIHCPPDFIHKPPFRITFLNNNPQLKYFLCKLSVTKRWVNQHSLKYFRQNL